jgi:hypothetical protein
MVIGLALGWGLGAAAVKASFAVRDHAALQRALIG